MSKRSITNSDYLRSRWNEALRVPCLAFGLKAHPRTHESRRYQFQLASWKADGSFVVAIEVCLHKTCTEGSLSTFVRRGIFDLTSFLPSPLALALSLSKYALHSLMIQLMQPGFLET